MQNARGKSLASFTRLELNRKQLSQCLSPETDRKGVKITDFTLKNVPRSAARWDAWADFFASRQTLNCGEELYLCHEVSTARGIVGSTLRNTTRSG